MLETPTGQYELKRLRSLAHGVYLQGKDLWFEEDDVYQEIICLLLSGLQLTTTMHRVKKKYNAPKKTVGIDYTPEKFLVDTAYIHANERILSPFELKKLESEYYRRINCLDQLSQDIMLLKAIGLPDKQISQQVGLSNENVRIKIHRSILQMKGLKNG